eukprot:3746207-Rhodomonas_salina.1
MKVECTKVVKGGASLEVMWTGARPISLRSSYTLSGIDTADSTPKSNTTNRIPECHTHATKCPVLTSHSMLLLLPLRRVRYWPSVSPWKPPLYLSMSLLCHIQYCYAMSSTVMRCPVLTQGRGTGEDDQLGEDGLSKARGALLKGGHDIVVLQEDLPETTVESFHTFTKKFVEDAKSCAVRKKEAEKSEGGSGTSSADETNAQVLMSISPRFCYAMPGTDLANRIPISLCTSYAMPDLAYAATMYLLRAMSGTDLERFLRMLLCDVRYRPSVCCYAISGTDLAYAATREYPRLGWISQVPTPISLRVYPYADLSTPVSLHARYAMSGTVIAYGATRDCHITYGAIPIYNVQYWPGIAYLPTRLLRDVRY